jgi:hypothetical protein
MLTCNCNAVPVSVNTFDTGLLLTFGKRIRMLLRHRFRGGRGIHMDAQP